MGQVLQVLQLCINCRDCGSQMQVRSASADFGGSEQEEPWSIADLMVEVLALTEQRPCARPVGIVEKHTCARARQRLAAVWIRGRPGGMRWSAGGKCGLGGGLGVCAGALAAVWIRGGPGVCAGSPPRTQQNP